MDVSVDQTPNRDLKRRSVSDVLVDDDRRDEPASSTAKKKKMKTPEWFELEELSHQIKLDVANHYSKRPIKARNYYNDEHITDWLIVLRHAFKKDRVAIVEPGLYQRLLSDKNGTTDIKSYVNGDKSPTLAFFPIEQGNHWTGYVFDMEENKIHYFDPLSGEPSAKKRKCMEAVASFFNMMMYTFVIFQAPDNMIQKDKFNCGPFLVWFFEIFLRSISVNAQMDVTTYRLQMKAAYESILEEMKGFLIVDNERSDRQNNVENDDDVIVVDDKALPCDIKQTNGRKTAERKVKSTAKNELGDEDEDNGDSEESGESENDESDDEEYSDSDDEANVQLDDDNDEEDEYEIINLAENILECNDEPLSKLEQIFANYFPTPKDVICNNTFNSIKQIMHKKGVKTSTYVNSMEKKFDAFTVAVDAKLKVAIKKNRDFVYLQNLSKHYLMASAYSLIVFFEFLFTKHDAVDKIRFEKIFDSSKFPEYVDHFVYYVFQERQRRSPNLSCSDKTEDLVCRYNLTAKGSLGIMIAFASALRILQLRSTNVDLSKKRLQGLSKRYGKDKEKDDPTMRPFTLVDLNYCIAKFGVFDFMTLELFTLAAFFCYTGLRGSSVVMTANGSPGIKLKNIKLRKANGIVEEIEADIEHAKTFEDINQVLKINIVRQGMLIDVVNLIVLYLHRRGVLSADLDVLEKFGDEQLFPSAGNKLMSSITDIREKLKLLADILKIPHAALTIRSFRKGFAVMRALEFINNNPFFTESSIVEHLTTTYNWASKQSLRYLQDPTSEFYKAVERIQLLIKGHISYDAFEQYLFVTDIISLDGYSYPEANDNRVLALADKIRSYVKSRDELAVVKRAHQYLSAALWRQIVRDRSDVFPAKRSCHIAPKIIDLQKSIDEEKVHLIFAKNCLICGEYCVRNTPSIKAYANDADVLKIHKMSYKGVQNFEVAFINLVAKNDNQKQCLSNFLKEVGCE